MKGNTEINGDIYGIGVVKGGTVNQNLILPKQKVPKQLTSKLGKDTIIGREKELDDIDKELEKFKILLVKGIGGVGKSTIASNYLHRHKNEYDYYGFFEGLESFESQLELAFKLEIEQGQDRLDRVLRELIKLEPESNKLLIIDDLKEIKENQEKLGNILELEHHGYRVLLTSRFKVKNVEIYPLLTLDPVDAQNLFLANYQTEELEKVNQIIEYLDYHPLFVELVATTISTMDYSLDEILKKFEQGALAEIKLIDDDGDEVSFNQNLKELFEMQKESLKDDYFLLLKQLAILPSIDIELNFLNKIFNRKLNGQLNFLLKQGWLVKSENGYKLHEVIKHYLLLPENAPSLEDIEIILKYFSIYTNQNDDWIVYLESVAQFLEKFNLKNKTVFDFYFQIALLYYEKIGNHKNAKKYFELNENLIKELNLKDTNIKVIYQYLGEIALNLENIDDSYSYQYRALKLYQEKDDKKNIAVCFNDIGRTYWKDARINHRPELLKIALSYYDKALTLYEKVDEFNEISTTCNNISLVYKDKKEYVKSHEYLNKALENNTKKMIAKFHNNKGKLYIHESNYELAKKYTLLALEIREELYFEYKLSENNDCFAESYDNLATIYFKRGEYKEAKIEQDKAIEIWSYNHDDNYSYLIDARKQLVLIEEEL